MSFHYRYRKQIIIGIIVVTFILVICGLSINKYISTKKNTKDKEKSIVTKSITKKQEKVEQKEKIFLSVDIKGEVNSPGIYKLEEGSRVIDVIEMAGGLTEKANTTVINLSKKIKDEMVIIIYSNKEVEDFSKTKEIEKKVIDNCIKPSEESLINDACIEDGNQEQINTLININTATLEELIQLPSIGEAKAKSIIEYRKNTPFNAIEDIMNVTGIGESLFDKIKTFITT